MKKTFRMITLLTVLVLTLAGFAGCTRKQATPQTPSQNQAQKSNKIGMVLSTLDNPFFVTMRDAAQNKAKELGYDLVVLDSQNDASKERSNVDDLLQQGIAVLIINPTDSDAVGNSVSAANQKNVPVITVDRSANSGTVVCHIASDNVAGGKMAGDFILQSIGGKGNIVELQGVPGASATRDRGKGFHDSVDNKAGVKVVASQAADFDRQKGLNVMSNIIQSTPDFSAVFAHNDEMALGAVKALNAAKKKAVVVGFDGTADAVAAVKAGDMTATVAQQPDQMGSLAVENAVKVAKGETVQKQIPVSLKLITK